MCCFRRSPAYCDFESQRNFVQKILGIIAYRKDFLAQLVKMEATPFETSEFIEQMRILENGFQLTAVSFDQALPSVNEPGEADAVIAFLQNDEEQRKLLIKTRDTTATKQ
jgi:3-deoxy-manno-octulosonate cytidylyltransferase (CMP-KDO synthetase)